MDRNGDKEQYNQQENRNNLLNHDYSKKDYQPLN